MSNTTDELAAANAALRAAVEARVAGSAPPADDTPPAAVAAAYAGFDLLPAAVVETPRFDEPIRVTASMPVQQLAANARAMRRVAAAEERKPRIGARLIGIAGRAGAGKSLVASMIPGAVVIGFSDPLYAMLSAMLGIPEPILRCREIKERPVEACPDRTHRELLQTLGTEWGRELVGDRIWVSLLHRRVMELSNQGVKAVAIADVRFGNEAEYIRARGGEVWRVRRPGTDAPARHRSEADDIEADAVIDNSGTVEELRAKVAALLQNRT